MSFLSSVGLKFHKETGKQDLFLINKSWGLSRLRKPGWLPLEVTSGIYLPSADKGPESEGCLRKCLIVHQFQCIQGEKWREERSLW